MTFRNMKFRVKDAEHSRQLQEALFKEGYVWSCGQDFVIETSKPYLYAMSDGKIMHGYCQHFFDDEKSEECCLSDLVEFSIRPRQQLIKERIEEILTAPLNVLRRE